MNALRKATHWQALMLGLALSLAACELPSEPLPGGSQIPAEAVGKWKGGLLSHSNFWDDHTGAHQGVGLGISILFDFQASGGYRQATYIFRRDYTCVTQMWSTTQGGVIFEDETFRVVPTAGKFKMTDSCNSGNNIERPLRSNELNGASYYWTPSTNAQGQRVLLIGPNPDSRETFRPDN